MNSYRVFLSELPFEGEFSHWSARGVWPARWIWHPQTPVAPFVMAYKITFSLEEATTLRFHIAADERYELFLDGRFIGRGNERGDGENWFFESYESQLDAGQHIFVARVWSLGERAPFAQMSVHHGLLFCPDDPRLVPLLATGRAPWEAKILGGFEWQHPLCAWGTGWNQRVRGEKYDWGHERGDGGNWVECPRVENSRPDSGAQNRIAPPGLGPNGEGVGALQEARHHHYLRPATLPPMLDESRLAGVVCYVAPFEMRPVALVPVTSEQNKSDERDLWQRLISNGQCMEIPPHTRRRVILDIGDYVCARPVLKVSRGQGSQIDIHWGEGLYERIDWEPGSWHKGPRDLIEGKFFCPTWNHEDGVGDSFHPDGPTREFSTLWWQAGRFIQILVETGEEPLQIEAFSLRETRYPLENEGRFAASDVRLESLIPMMVRGLQMCAHETYMDCPYYEQLQYIGDTRLQCLVTYCLTRDDRLPRRALQLFDWSRLNNGVTQSRYPSKVRQITAPFALWWVAMVHDYALWRGDGAFVKSLLPGVRAVCDHFWNLVGENGLMRAPEGYNFFDHVRAWESSVPPDGHDGFSGVFGWHFVHVLRLASELETWFGDEFAAQMQQHRAQKLAATTDQAFWNEERGLYADDLSHTHWSEHAQLMALLSSLVPPQKVARVGAALLESPDLARCTIYFAHYLFEVHRLLRRPDAFFARLREWDELAQFGLKTTTEMPEPTRSDCHAWGAHPLFHFYATLAGIRPIKPAFSEVEIAPLLGALEWLEALLPHPQGQIYVRAQKSIQGDTLNVSLPEGIKWKIGENA